MDQRQKDTETLRRRLTQATGGRIVVGESEGALVLDGWVPSRAARERAGALAASLAPDRQIINLLEVERHVVGEGADTATQRAGAPGEDTADVTLADDLSSGGLPEVPLETDETDVVDDTVYDEVPPVEPDPSYFAPTDPVIGTGAEGQTTILGGWEPTSMSSDEIEPSAEDRQPGDEALADAIIRELHEDAATTALQVEVQVLEGVARLRGTVPDLEDAENAEAVASRVPGVRDVIEELTIQQN
jgi:osmotically-inducible protein OsmY